MRTVIVNTVGAHRAHRCLDIAERQILIQMEGTAQPYHHHILFQKIDAARWVTLEAGGIISADDLSEEVMIPLVRGEQFPAEGKPCLAFESMTDVQLAGFRTRAAQYAEIMGVPTANLITGGGIDAVWLFADTAHPSFGQEVPESVLGQAALTRMEDSAGLVQVEENGVARWTAMERLLRTDVGAWLVEKRSGAGRDPRLIPNAALAADGSRPLFRQVCVNFAKTVEPNRSFFEGPSTTLELTKAIAASGHEPQAFISQWISSSGANPKSSVVIEFSNIIHCLWMLSCIDGLDIHQLAGAEHLSRRAFQIQKAIKKSPQNPDFVGLEPFMKHTTEATGVAASPSFDRHVAETLKAEAQVMKQMRLSREETEADSKRKREDRGQPHAKSGSNKGKKKTE